MLFVHSDYLFPWFLRTWSLKLSRHRRTKYSLLLCFEKPIFKSCSKRCTDVTRISVAKNPPTDQNYWNEDCDWNMISNSFYCVPSCTQKDKKSKLAKFLIEVCSFVDSIPEKSSLSRRRVLADKKYLELLFSEYLKKHRKNQSMIIREKYKRK